MIKLSNIKAIFFDLDGTLTSYSLSAENAINHIYSSIKKEIPGIKRETFLNTYWKIFTQIEKQQHNGKQGGALNDRKTRFEKVLEALKLPVSESLSQRMALLYSEGRIMKLHVFEDASRTLSQLSTKYILGVITEGDKNYQRKQLENAGLDRFFKYVVISDDIGFHKPGTQIFKEACKLAKIKPSQACMVGDRIDWDLQPAKTIGMQTIWFTQDPRYYDKKSIHNPGIDMVVGSFKEIMNIFNLEKLNT